jgi:hypothetical protein
LTIIVVDTVMEGKVMFTENTEFELQRAGLVRSSDDAHMFLAPEFFTIYTGFERSYVDAGVTTGVEYAYRVRFSGGQWSALQVLCVETANALDARP